VDSSHKSVFIHRSIRPSIDPSVHPTNRSTIHCLFLFVCLCASLGGKKAGGKDNVGADGGGGGGSVLERVKAAATTDAWPRMTYSDALDELRKAPVDFGFPLEWGSSLQTAHEKYLAQTVANGLPVVVTDYPIEQKAFYSRANADGRTTAAFDILVPQIVSGS
jgi:hypothetical protein